MVTGGTGFFGGHITEALLAAGHQPRLLVRDPEKLGRMCALFDIEPELVEAVVGDILDPTSVADALDSCDACVHSAAFATLNPELMPKALEVNAPGPRIVLDAAMAVGCDPIVHVSTLSVIFPPTGSMFSADDPVHAGGMPYNASKAEADLYARGLQDDAAPVVIVYPSGLTGPLDLGMNAVAEIWSQTLASELVTYSDTGGYLLPDVRDAAQALVALLRPGQGPRRYMMGGQFLTWTEFADALEAVTGLHRTPVRMTRADLEAQISESEAVDIALGVVPSDDQPLHRDTGMQWRPVQETMRDTIRWLTAEGHLDPRWAPALQQ
jgi:nucleoside-diphosphate-sugar epimerase